MVPRHDQRMFSCMGWILRHHWQLISLSCTLCKCLKIQRRCTPRNWQRWRKEEDQRALCNVPQCGVGVLPVHCRDAGYVGRSCPSPHAANYFYMGSQEGLLKIRGRRELYGVHIDGRSPRGWTSVGAMVSGKRCKSCGARRASLLPVVAFLLTTH